MHFKFRRDDIVAEEAKPIVYYLVDLLPGSVMLHLSLDSVHRH
jgi:hypothetical protein